MKKCMKVIALAAMLVSLPVLSFAAKSPSYSDNDDSGSSSSSSTSTAGSGTVTAGTGPSGTSVSKPTSPSVVTAPNGTKTTVGETTKDAAGTTISLVVGTTTSTGTPVTMNDKGDTVIGSVAVTIASGVAETAGLPETAVATIENLNKGSALTEAFPGAGLDGYAKVGNTRAIVATELTKGVNDNIPTEVSMVVDTLPDNVQSVVVMCYNNATGQWIKLDASVDPVTKKVTFVIPGSCTIQIAVR